MQKTAFLFIIEPDAGKKPSDMHGAASAKQCRFTPFLTYIAPDIC